MVSRSVSALLVAFAVKQPVGLSPAVCSGLRVISVECGAIEIASGIAIHGGVAPPARSAIDMHVHEPLTLLLM